jgi:hypothetical protein
MIIIICLHIFHNLRDEDMNQDKRKVSTDALETLGMIIDEAQKRDAIHLAVEPIVAKEVLIPGQDVGADGTTNNPVGIVDPFLKKAVQVGERFWLVIYPRQINSLRHVWTHPAFEDEINLSDVLFEKQKSIIWMKNFARELSIASGNLEDYYDYDYLLRSTKQYLDTGKFMQAYRYEDGTPSEFWDHYMIITGDIRASDNRKSNFFLCSC